MPLFEGLSLRPTVMTAEFFTPSMARPQFMQLPPEKGAKPVLPLVNVSVSECPLRMYTSVLLAVHTAFPVKGFTPQEFTAPGVAIGVSSRPGVGDPPKGSICLTIRPLLSVLHEAFGT